MFIILPLQYWGNGNLRKKSHIVLANLRDELQRIQNSEELFLNNNEFAEHIGMSSTWYATVLNSKQTSVYKRTIKNIAERLGKRFEINGDQIRFFDVEEAPDDPEEDDALLLSQDTKGLIAKLEAKNPEFRGRLQSILDRFLAYPQDKQEALLALMKMIVENYEDLDHK